MNNILFLYKIYPALMGSKPPSSKFSESKEIRWELSKVSLYDRAECILTYYVLNFADQCNTEP